MDQVFIDRLLAERANVNEQQKELLERASAENRLPTAEENEAHARFDARYAELTQQVNEWIERGQRELELDVSRAAVEAIVRPVDGPSSKPQMSQAERWFRGQAAGDRSLPDYFDVDLAPAANMFRAIRAGLDEKEARAIYTDGGASAGSLVVPTDFIRQLYQYIEAESAVRRTSYVFTTAGGNPMTFPKVGTHGVGTQVIAQGTAIGGTDPIFATMTLNSFKFGQLVKVSREAAVDTGFDLLGFVAQNIGRAVGRIVDTAYVSGDGSTGPNGIMTAASVGAATGGSLIALGGGASASYTTNVDCVFTLQHSIVDAYRQNAVFIMNDTTAGTLRKLRDGNQGTIGSYIWAPVSTFQGVAALRMPDIFLGYPVYTDVNYGTNGSAVKPLSFGDMSAYYIRDSGPFRFEASTERYFDTDELGYKGVLRTDSDLIDTNAVKVLRQSVSTT